MERCVTLPRTTSARTAGVHASIARALLGTAELIFLIGAVAIAFL